MLLKAPIALVDAFADVPFSGNPAGICLVDEFPADVLMQSVAFEFNWSETAFLVRLEPSFYHIRWFSPLDEAPMCGHATLAAAHFLFEYNYVIGSSVEFQSLSGQLIVTKQTNENGESWLVMDFPAISVKDCTDAAEVESIQDVFDDDNMTVNIKSILKDSILYIVVLANEDEVRRCRPNLAKLKKLPCRAISVTAQSSNGCDFVSRYFAPQVGIPEDPVCGSSHCRLAPFWAKALGKDTLVAKQLSQRGGVLHLSLCPQTNRVSIAGQARTILTGQMAI
ncbi:MAG: PhzF family phenazine biosynthesis protein [Holosporales bacterium]|jgi:PhzF family phenazine biosynthesis protein|nr:PhzF family phenazine biosynthesis protein [Holosporales bacterium]